MNETEPVHDTHLEKVGERIAEARRALKLEREDIAERSRIPLRHLEAIEDSNYEALPPTTYSAGFVKTFAAMVGLDGTALASDFRAERGEISAARIDHTRFEPADPALVPPRLLAMVALATAILLAIAYLIWRSGEGDDVRQQLAAGTTPQAAPAAIPAPQKAPPPIAAPSAPIVNDKVVLTATDRVWIKVAEKEGPTLFMGELAPGQSYEVPPGAVDPRLLTGRPQMLRATIGQRAIPALGTGERTISNVGLKAPALTAWIAGLPAAAVATPAPRSNVQTNTPESAAPAATGQNSSGNVATTPTP